MNNVTYDVSSTLKDIKSVVDNLLLLLSDKEKLVVKKRFCIDAPRKFTLEEIGQEFGVTRERIRQIEKNALAKMKRNVFNTALRHLHDHVLNLVEDSGGLIRERDLFGVLKKIYPVQEGFNENEIHFSLVLHDNLECIGNTITFYPYVRRRDLTDYALKYASNHLVNQLNKYGDVKNLDYIHSDLKGVLEEHGFDRQRTKSLIRIDKRLTILDDDLVGLIEWRHIHPRTLRDKILYILRHRKSPMHFSAISEEISAAKFDNRPVNIQAVHNELIRHEQFVLIGRGIYALKEWGYEKGTVVEVIEKILAKNNELDEETIVEKVLKRRQVKRITVSLALKNSVKFERIGRKRYKLKA